MDDSFFALSLVTDGGKKLVPIGQHFTKLDKFELFNATKDTLWKGTEKLLLFKRGIFKPIRRLTKTSFFYIINNVESVKRR